MFIKIFFALCVLTTVWFHLFEHGFQGRISDLHHLYCSCFKKYCIKIIFIENFVKAIQSQSDFQKISVFTWIYQYICYFNYYFFRNFNWAFILKIVLKLQETMIRGVNYCQWFQLELFLKFKISFYIFFAFLLNFYLWVKKVKEWDRHAVFNIHLRRLYIQVNKLRCLLWFKIKEKSC